MKRVYIGLDTHKSFTYATAIDSKGNVVKQEKLPNFGSKFKRFFKELDKHELEIAIESTEMIMPFVRSLERYGSIKVAHPTKLRLIAESKIKTDKIDSTVIAQLLRTDFMPESYVPSKEIREIRELCRERYSLKVMTTKVKNQVRHYLLSQGIIRNDNIFTKSGRIGIRKLSTSMNRKLDILEYLEDKIAEIDTEIKERTKDIEEISWLIKVCGIGSYTATLLYSEIADIDRFKNFNKLNSYVGLNPSIHQSGGKIRFGRITKNGCGLVRWALIQCAWSAIRADPILREHYQRLRQRKGSNKAIVAVARKLLKRVYVVWKRKGVYQR